MLVQGCDNHVRGCNDHVSSNDIVATWSVQGCHAYIIIVTIRYDQLVAKLYLYTLLYVPRAAILQPHYVCMYMCVY